MPRLLLAAALALAPSLAAAQAPTASRTFAGCDIYACATFTLRYTTSTVLGQANYAVSGDGALTLRAPIVTGAYGGMPLPTLGGGFFEYQDYEDLAFVPYISLVGHAAGDVLPFQIMNGTGRVQPVLDVTSFSGALVDPNLAVTGARVDITLAAISAVPEPSTLALATAGLLAVGGMAVRRRRTTTA